MRGVDGLTEKRLTRESGLEGALYLKTSEETVPWWVEFLDPISSDDLRAPAIRTTSALLVLRPAISGPNSRIVCFTFGHGRYLINQRYVDRTFGIRVALNTVDPARLRGFNTWRQDDVVVRTTLQSSSGTDLGAFSLDIFRDILQGAAGATKSLYEAVVGPLVRGSTGVTIDVRISAEGLAEKARDLLQISRRDDYKTDFAFVDFVQRVDEDTSESLDRKLAAALIAVGEQGDSEFRCLYLAAPEVLELEKLEGFAFSSERGREKTFRTDLRLEEYLSTREDDVSIDRIHGDKVLIRYEGAEHRNLASVYRCLIAEVDGPAGETYQLVDGDWYQIESDFVKRIRSDTARIRLSSVRFPVLMDTDDEPAYNKRAASELGALLLDKKTIPIGGGANKIEFCDLALPDRKTLVFAKRRSQSSTLSHLWSQATVAMDSVLGDEAFRRRLTSRIRRLNPTFVDLAEDGKVGSDYNVVYLILGTAHNGSPAEDLPFFSQVALAQAARTLGNMGVGVSLAGLPWTPAAS